MTRLFFLDGRTLGRPEEKRINLVVPVKNYVQGDLNESQKQNGERDCVKERYVLNWQVIESAGRHGELVLVFPLYFAFIKMVVKNFFSCRTEGGGNRGIVGLNDKGSGRITRDFIVDVRERRMGGDADLLLREFQNRHQIKGGEKLLVRCS